MTEDRKILLKIDIEGDEYKIVEDVCRYSKKTELLIIEFHQTEKMQIEFSNSISVLKEYFHLVHIHGNNFNHVASNGIPNVIECTFVNKDLFKGEYVNRKDLPIPKIDYPCDPSKSDIKLSF